MAPIRNPLDEKLIELAGELRSIGYEMLTPTCAIDGEEWHITIRIIEDEVGHRLLHRGSAEVAKAVYRAGRIDWAEVDRIGLRVKAEISREDS